MCHGTILGFSPGPSSFFKKFVYFLIEGQLLYRSLLFSVKPEHESAIGIHISPPSWTSLPSPSLSYPSRLIQSPCLSFLRHPVNSWWLSILYMVIKVSMLLSPYISPSPPFSYVHKSVLYVCFSNAALQINSSVSSF